MPSGLLVISISITILGNIIALLTSLELDMTMITNCIGIVLLYIAIANNPSVEYSVIARKELFDSMDDVVFVMSKQGQVLDINAAARNWLGLIGFSGELPYEFERITGYLDRYGAPIKKIQCGPQMKVCFCSSVIIWLYILWLNDMLSIKKAG